MEQIDILMATYNGEKYLREQIDSILNQTYSNFRLLISDDCSKDGTQKILKEYEEKDSRIIIFCQDKNLGYVKNFEFLLTKVENEIYMLSDQDDFWLPDKIEKTYNKMINSNADLVFTDLEVVNEKLETMFPSFNDYMKLTRKIKKYIDDYRLQYLYNCVTGCTLMSKKKFLNSCLPLPTISKYAIHDTWIACVVANKGKIAYLDEKTIKYRQHGENQVGTDKISHKFKKLDDVRELFLNVKIGLFKTYVENGKVFDENVRRQNQKALDYFEMLKQKRHVNFVGWNVFHKLYRTETFTYYMENFLIMNFPGLSRVLFKIRYQLLKILGKR